MPARCCETGATTTTSTSEWLRYGIFLWSGVFALAILYEAMAGLLLPACGRRVPESLRLVGALLALSVAGAAISFAVQEYQAIDKAERSAEALTGGHVDAGKAAIAARQCGAWHEIPGVDRANGIHISLPCRVPSVMNEST